MSLTTVTKTGTISDCFDDVNDMIGELPSTDSGKGASQVGIEDSGSLYTATNVEAALAEMMTYAAALPTIATDTIWDAAGDTVYGTGANTAAKLAAGAANLKLFMNAAGNAPEWANGIKVGTFSRARDAADGDVATSGVGFKPSFLFVMGTTNTGARVTFGMTDGTNQACLPDIEDTANVQRWMPDSAKIISHSSTLDKFQNAIIKSFDADGFTLTWDNVNSPPAGSIYFYYVAFR